MRARVLVCLVALTAGSVSAGGQALAQTAQGRISGVVVSPDGEPLGGICVEAFDSGYASTETASDGSYALSVEPGSHTVAFNAGGCGPREPGFAPEFFDDARTEQEAQPVTVGAGEAREDVDAALEATGSFSGTVLDDETGDPLEGICVLAFDAELGTFGEGVTGAGGSYRVADVPAGEYAVVFGDCTDPYVYVSEVYDDVQISGGAPAGEPEPVVVTGEQDTAGIDAGLAEGGALQGVVTGLHTGEEQPLVCVGLFEADAQEGAPPVALTVTGALPTPDAQAASPGTFVLGGVVPGDYVLAYNPSDCADTGYLTRWYDGELTRGDADVITVVEGEVVQDLDAVVTPEPSIDFACPFELGSDAAPYSDVPEGNVHRRAIECLTLFDVVRGRSDGTYAPAAPVTRAQLASFVARTIEASGVTLPADPPDAFDDDNGSVHETTIDQLAAAGVVSGKGERRYAPAETVSRAQMATFLVNAYESATGIELRSAGDRFPDDDGNVHEASIDKAATAGITAGTGSGYAPNGIVRRDAMASFLARLLDRVQRDLALLPGGSQGEGRAEGQVEGQSEGLARMSVGRTAAPGREAAVGSLRRLVQEAAGRGDAG